MSRKTYKQLKNHELAAIVAAGGVLFDIRRPEEWSLTGVIEGSRLLTFFDQNGGSDPVSWLAQFEKMVAREQPAVLICRSGYRTSLICEFLLEATARTEIYNLTDGILGYLAEGYPVVKELPVAPEWG